jgi:hypothetical protein
LKKAHLDQNFSEARSGTIAHKNKKRITAVTHYELYLGKASENLQTLPGTPVSVVTGLIVNTKNNC